MLWHIVTKGRGIDSLKKEIYSLDEHQGMGNPTFWFDHFIF
jgi:hypothetical protein